MKLRIKKYPKGYVVEIQKNRLFFGKYWTHFISVSGINHEPWYFSTFDHAINELKKKVEWDCISNSRIY